MSRHLKEKQVILHCKTQVCSKVFHENGCKHKNMEDWNNTKHRVFASKKKTKTPAYTFKKGNCAKRKKEIIIMFLKKKTSLFVIFLISTC